MMKDVVHSHDGTGKKASVSGYTVWKDRNSSVPKNGEYKKNLHNALFIGILGDPDPKYVALSLSESQIERVLGVFMPHLFLENFYNTL